MGRMAVERHGDWVRSLEMFNVVSQTLHICGRSAAQLLGTSRFVGSIMQTTMNQKRKIGVTACEERAGTSG